MLLLRLDHIKDSASVWLSLLGYLLLELNNPAARKPKSALVERPDGERSTCRETVFPVSASPCSLPSELMGISNSWVFCRMDWLLVGFPYPRHLVAFPAWSSELMVIHPSVFQIPKFCFYLSFAIVCSPVFFILGASCLFIPLILFNSVENEAEINAYIPPSMFNWKCPLSLSKFYITSPFFSLTFCIIFESSDYNDH